MEGSSEKRCGADAGAEEPGRRNRRRPARYVGKLLQSGLERSVYAVKLKVLKQERTALASYPRSGNTWLRFLLESSTGMKCGTIYREESIMDRPDRGIAIKTHRCDSFKYTRAIHLVRHPMDVLDSYFRWKRDYARQTARDWERFARFRIAQWVRHTEAWLAAPYGIFLLRYEDLLLDTEPLLTDLLSWLECPRDAETVAKAVRESSIDRLREKVPDRDARHFFRRGGAGKSLDRYTRELLELVRREAEGTMRKVGYAVPEGGSGEPWFQPGMFPGEEGKRISGGKKRGS